MAERLRGRCSVCGRDVALTAKTRVIGPHRELATWRQCDGGGRPPLDDPTVDALIVRLAGLISDLDSHIERRALEIVSEIVSSRKPPGGQ